MPLPSDFQFSQKNLQDYSECPRRFQLRYLQKMLWPAVETEPVLEQERLILQGQLFHRMVNQFFLDLSEGRLSASAQDPDLKKWWGNFLNKAPPNLPVNRLPEFTLSTPFAGFRLLAKYDLLAISPEGKAVIVDWKTSLQKPSRQFLEKKWQTWVYPLVLVEAGKDLNGGAPFLAGNVEMIYWFAEHPDEPVVIHYSVEKYSQQKRELEALIGEIDHRSEGNYPLTLNEKACRFCNYRSLCVRGTNAGRLDELEEIADLADAGISINFDDIEEIGY